MTRRFKVFSNVPGDPGSGGGPGPASVPAPAPSAAPAPAAPPSPAAPISAAPPASPAPVTPEFRYAEDRSAWVPPDRFSQTELRARQLQAMLEAGTGIRMQEPENVDPRVQAARAALERVLPGIGQFHSVMPKLMQLQAAMDEHGITVEQLARLPEITSTTDMQWQAHARQVTGQIFSALTADTGGAEVAPEDRAEVVASFERWLRSDQSGVRTQRYLHGDPSLPTEFVARFRGFTGSFSRQAQADAQAAAAARRVQGLPAAPSQGAAPVPGSSAPAGPRDIDSLNDSAWAAMTAGRRAAG